MFLQVSWGNDHTVSHAIVFLKINQAWSSCAPSFKGRFTLARISAKVAQEEMRIEALGRNVARIAAVLIFQLIPVACPNHFASGDVCTLLSILKSAPVAADLLLVNQDLAGFFTSIDQDRFIGAWFMLLDFLRPHMDVSDNEAFSVYPGKTNNPGDIIKGRTFRRLNATRKIIIKDVPDLLRSALNMQTFALGHQCLQQSRGSPMGSPLSPALCLMVVSISEQIWSINF